MQRKFVSWSIVITLIAAPPLAAQHRSGSSRGGGHRSHPRTYSSSPRSHAALPRTERPRAKAPPAHPQARSSEPRSHSVHPRSTPRGSIENRGRIQRSQAAKDQFMRQSGHAQGWPGHVVDHVVPLACGGADTPSNMQWQPTEEAKAKDKVERKGCSTRR